MSTETEKQIPCPLWPMPDGWEKPTIRLWNKPERFFGVFLPDITGGGWSVGHKTLDDALAFVARDNRESSLNTEYTERRELLAEFLCNLVYGEGAWDEVDEDTLLNYRLDADDIIKANPHLLSLEERERLEHIIPELRYGNG